MALATAAVMKRLDELQTQEAPPLQLPQAPSRPALLDRPANKSVDVWMLAGIAIAIVGLIGGIKSTGVSLAYFFQPAGALIVLGGTLGITLVGTPMSSLRHCAQRVIAGLRSQTANREALIEEIVWYAKLVRRKDLVSIDGLLDRTSHPFLREAVKLAMDVQTREQLQAALETKVRLRERHGETDARVLESAGGFAPTIGVLGTVVGLVDVLRQFSNLAGVALGIGTAFVSTFYGLALANLVLLPAAHRIRARIADTAELEEMMVEGGLCLYDGIHHSLVRERLNNFLRAKAGA